jgi:hypothetical protein
MASVIRFILAEIAEKEVELRNGMRARGLVHFREKPQ